MPPSPTHLPLLPRRMLDRPVAATPSLVAPLLSFVAERLATEAPTHWSVADRTWTHRSSFGSVAAGSHVATTAQVTATKKRGATWPPDLNAPSPGAPATNSQDCDDQIWEAAPSASRSGSTEPHPAPSTVVMATSTTGGAPSTTGIVAVTLSPAPSTTVREAIPETLRHGSGAHRAGPGRVRQILGPLRPRIGWHYCPAWSGSTIWNCCVLTFSSPTQTSTR